MSQEEKYGVKETEEALAAIFGIIDVIAANNGKSALTIVGKLIPSAGEVITAINGGEKILDELKDLHESELNRLYSGVSQRLEDAKLDDGLKGCIEADITVLSSLVVAIQRHREYAKS